MVHIKLDRSLAIGFAGCAALAFTMLVISAAICLGLTELIRWAFHTPFPQTLIAVILFGIVISAIGGASNK